MILESLTAALVAGNLWLTYSLRDGVSRADERSKQASNLAIDAMENSRSAQMRVDRLVTDGGEDADEVEHVADEVAG